MKLTVISPPSRRSGPRSRGFAKPRPHPRICPDSIPRRIRRADEMGRAYALAGSLDAGGPALEVGRPPLEVGGPPLGADGLALERDPGLEATGLEPDPGGLAAWISWRVRTSRPSRRRESIPLTAAAAPESVVIRGTPCWVAVRRIAGSSK